MLGALVEWGGVRSHVSRDRPMPGSCSSSASSAFFLSSPRASLSACADSLRANAPRVQMAKTMYQDKSMQVRDICQTLRISRSTLYRWIASQQRQAFTPIRA